MKPCKAFLIAFTLGSIHYGCNLSNPEKPPEFSQAQNTMVNIGDIQFDTSIAEDRAILCEVDSTRKSCREWMQSGLIAGRASGNYNQLAGGWQKAIRFQIVNMTAAHRKLTLDAIDTLSNIISNTFVEGPPEVISGRTLPYLVIDTDMSSCAAGANGCSGFGPATPRRVHINPTKSGILFQGIAIHELMHTLRFGHEHQRRDRDAFVSVGSSADDYAKWPHYSWDGSVASSPFGSYDFFSIMHYRPDGNMSILPPYNTNARSCDISDAGLINASVSSPCVGQRRFLTQTDVLALRNWYGTSSKKWASLDEHERNGTTFSRRFTDKAPFSTDAQAWLSGDFDGNGHYDMAKIYLNGSAFVDVTQSTGGNFGAIKTWMSGYTALVGNQKWLACDFTGDGKTDLATVYNDNGLASIDLHTSNGTSFSTASAETRYGSYNSNMKWVCGDFTGDGRADIANVFSDGGLASIDLHVATISGTRTIFAGRRAQTKYGGWSADQTWLYGDFNGDGDGDLMNVFNDGGMASMDIHRNDGSGMLEGRRFQTKQGGSGTSFRWFSGDFNGDGLSDIGKTYDHDGFATIDIHTATPNGFSMARSETKAGEYWSEQQWMSVYNRSTNKWVILNLFGIPYRS